MPFVFEGIEEAPAAQSKGFVFEGIEPEKKVGKARSISSAGLKGLVEGIQGQIGGPLQLVKGPVSPELGQRLLEQALPSNEGVAESITRRAAKLSPAVLGNKMNLIQKALTLGSGTAAGEIAQQAGGDEFAQGLAEMTGLAAPDVGRLVKQGTRSLKDIIKPQQVEKLPSGLTKPKAVESNLQKYGTLTAARKEKALDEIGQEASKLTKESIHKNVPISKQIESGFDFEGNFEKNFKDIQKAAAKHNPDVDITPISDLMEGARQKIRGIPKPHPEALKIKAETKAFGNRPQTSLHNLLKIYRSNNKKQKSIFETSRLTGKQQEYSDFLADYNRAIAKSFENTFPKDSAWVKLFKDNNAQYKGFKDAQKTLTALEPITEGRFTDAQVKKLAFDPKSQKKLALSMGQKGADEVVQIAKDLDKASSSLKNIPTRDWKAWEAVAPVSIFIPGIGKILGGGITIHKAYKFGKMALGYMLSTPERRNMYKGAIKAIVQNDLPAYRKLASSILKDTKSEED